MGGQVLAPGVVRAQHSAPRPQGRTCGGGRGRAFFLPTEEGKALPTRQAALSGRDRSCPTPVRDCHPSGRKPDAGFRAVRLKPGPTGGRRHIRDITEFQTASSTVLNTASFPDACSRAFAALQSGRSAKRPNPGHLGPALRSLEPVIRRAIMMSASGHHLAWRSIVQCGWQNIQSQNGVKYLRLNDDYSEEYANI